ncbi:MAG: alpha-L-fucosidase, partial [Kiritimatiellia bacterium]
MVAPPDCRYTYNPESKRLYLHILAWPFNAIHLPGMDGRVKYAQFLHDASEVRVKSSAQQEHASLSEKSVAGDLTIRIPVNKPNVEIPVIELFLR